MTKKRALAGVLTAIAATIACGNDDGLDAVPPAKVTDLEIVNVTQTDFTLEWTAPGDDGRQGRADSYTLKRSSAAITSANFSAATTVPGVPDPKAAGAAEQFTVTGLDSIQTYYFALRAADEVGNRSPVSDNAKWPPGAVQDIPPFKDNTTYSESDTLSNAKGIHVFIGNNAGNLDLIPDARRALLAFAVADSIPAGATIDSVRLTLALSKSAPGANDRIASLHRLLADWGEGTSDAPGEEGGGGSASPGDATWLHRFYAATPWSAPGGDYDATPSASQTVGSILNSTYTWSSAQMAADVQTWLDSPAGNFGWIMIGDESEGSTAKRFASVENLVTSRRPKLTVYYTSFVP